MSATDSAGRPWAGRAFEPSPWGSDDGRAPQAFLDALEAFHAGAEGPEAVVEALRPARLLIPLLAEVGGVAGPGGRGHGAELALVTVAAPDGRAVLPAFSSVEAMARWNPMARPVPAPARQVALGAAGDGTDLVIVDPASPTQFGLRRGAVEALARDIPWLPSWRDPDVGRAMRTAIDDEVAVTTVRVETDDPRCLLEGAEVRATVVVTESLERSALDALLGRIRARWSADERIVRRVDSLAIRVEAAGR